jgi:hypothetical protein
MKDEKKYEDHVIRRWNFSKELADKLANEDLRNALTISIFDKTCSPHHYFLRELNEGVTAEKPSERQIKYAEDLGIINPEKYSKHELSKKIDEARKMKLNPHS